MFAKLFPSYFIDLTKLPVSSIRLVDYLNNEVQCKVLDDKILEQHTEVSAAESKLDVKNIAVTYSHPVLQLYFGKGLQA